MLTSWHQTWDSFDFFTVSLTVRELSEDFGRSKADITWGITLVLMFRSVGSVIFGLFSDRFGRKWPFIVNNILFIVLELVSVPTLGYLPKGLARCSSSYPHTLHRRETSRTLWSPNTNLPSCPLGGGTDLLFASLAMEI